MNLLDFRLTQEQAGRVVSAVSESLVVDNRLKGDRGNL